MHKETHAIRRFIATHVGDHPKDIGKLTCAEFGISRQSVSRHLRKMVEEGILEATGQTRARRYEVGLLSELTFELRVTPEMEEDRVWVDYVAPKVKNAPKNVIDICVYAFTEMLNNVIDHSESEVVSIEVKHFANRIQLDIHDLGVGIFKKIKIAKQLHDERQAILELAKGKLTTDPKHHTGEGIFFTCRMCDEFCMRSGELFFSHRPESDWLIEAGREHSGTSVYMIINLSSSLKVKDMFDRFTSSDDLSFSRTHVPLRLAQYDSTNLVSRSQAKRVLARFERFEEVLLDFEGVDYVGQAFADEIFRVFQLQHPDVAVLAINDNDVVAGMIKRARDLYAMQSTDR